jgi:ligand-binding sensor protein
LNALLTLIDFAIPSQIGGEDVGHLMSDDISSETSSLNCHRGIQGEQLRPPFSHISDELTNYIPKKGELGQNVKSIPVVPSAGIATMAFKGTLG